MPTSTEVARAKVNLTLAVLGRRLDGYHELASLVAFADVGDRLSLTPGGKLSLTVDGPFATALGGPNLVLEACRALSAACPGLASGHFHLEKRLPVAAGLGGGSADAAAALRLLVMANGLRPDDVDLASVASAIGADVRVCLDGRAALMWGIGEKVTALPPLPPAPAVIVNPGHALSTADAYRALDAPPAERGGASPTAPDPFADVAALAQYMSAHGNDLEPVAEGLVPAIASAKAALMDQKGALIARMSGSGASVFALFGSDPQARLAADIVGKHEPGWWVRATRLE